MSTLTQSSFYRNLNVAGTLTGPTVTRIDNEKTAVANSLANHITNYNSSETANKTAREGLQTQVTTNTNTLTTFNNTFTSRTTFVDTELKRIDNQHLADDSRLTTVETELKNVDTDIKAQISSQIAKHNTDIANLDPRVANLESKIQIDEASKTITIPGDFRLVVLGAIDIGTQEDNTTTTDPPPPTTPSGDTAPSQNLGDYRWVNDQEGSFGDITFYNSNITYFQSNPITFGSTPTQVQLDEINNYFGNGGTINELYAGQADNSFKIVYTK